LERKNKANPSKSREVATSFVICFLLASPCYLLKLLPLHKYRTNNSNGFTAGCVLWNQCKGVQIWPYFDRYNH